MRQGIASSVKETGAPCESRNMSLLYFVRVS
jgi:hypothetical protein